MKGGGGPKYFSRIEPYAAARANNKGPRGGRAFRKMPIVLNVRFKELSDRMAGGFIEF